MRLIRTIIMLGLAGSVLMGCASTKSNTVVNVPSLDQNQNLAVWQAGTPNPLQYYVPNDAALAFITQRNQDMHSPGLRLIYEILTSPIPFSEIRRAFRSYERYNDIADELGLNPDGQFDAAGYLYDYYAVVHLTFNDAHKTMTKLDDLFKEEFEDTICATTYENGEFKNDCKPMLAISDVPGWRIYQLADNRYHVLMNAAVHYSTNVITVVWYTPDHPLPEHVLAGASAPFAPRSRDDNAVFVGRINAGNFVEFIARQPLIAESLDEEYWNEDDDVYGFVDPERKRAYCEKEQNTACTSKWERRDRCERLAAAHCPKPEKDPAECTDCNVCSCFSSAVQPEIDDDDDDYLYDCSWYLSCIDCAYEDDCWSAMSGEQNASYKDSLKKLGYTSVSDDVCIKEAKALFSDLPSAELEAIVTNTGAVGFKLLLQSTQEHINAYRSMILEHAVPEDNDGQIKGYLAVDIPKYTYKLFDELKQKLGQSKHECTQIQALESVRMHAFNELKEELSDEPWLEDAFLNMGSASILLKHFSNPRRLKKPVMWGYVENSPSVLQMIENKILSEINDDADDPEYIKYEINGNKLIFGSQQFDPKTVKYKMVKDNNTFLDLQIREDFISHFAGGSNSWMLSDYRLYFGLTQNNEIVFSVIPTAK